MRTLILTAFTAMLMGGAVSQASAAPPASTMAATKTTPKATMHGPAAPRTAVSLDCSKQADAKNLHGKDREKFRKTCMKGK